MKAFVVCFERGVSWRPTIYVKIWEVTVFRGRHAWSYNHIDGMDSCGA
jgi:hypothetical protein